MFHFLDQWKNSVYSCLVKTISSSESVTGCTGSRRINQPQSIHWWLAGMSDRISGSWASYRNQVQFCQSKSTNVNHCFLRLRADETFPSPILQQVTCWMARSDHFMRICDFSYGLSSASRPDPEWQTATAAGGRASGRTRRRASTSPGGGEVTLGITSSSQAFLYYWYQSCLHRFLSTRSLLMVLSCVW